MSELTFLSQRCHLLLEPCWCACPSTCMGSQSRTRPSWDGRTWPTTPKRNWSRCERPSWSSASCWLHVSFLRIPRLVFISPPEWDPSPPFLLKVISKVWRRHNRYWLRTHQHPVEKCRQCSFHSKTVVKRNIFLFKRKSQLYNRSGIYILSTGATPKILIPLARTERAPLNSRNLACGVKPARQNYTVSP